MPFSVITSLFFVLLSVFYCRFKFFYTFSFLPFKLLCSYFQPFLGHYLLVIILATYFSCLIKEICCFFVLNSAFTATFLVFYNKLQNFLHLFSEKNLKALSIHVAYLQKMKFFGFIWHLLKSLLKSNAYTISRFSINKLLISYC